MKKELIMILRENKTFKCTSKCCEINSKFEHIEMTFNNKLKAIFLFFQGKADLIIQRDQHGTDKTEPA